ncbi:uncharacterized protein N7459_007826 [Penicillium hispanicum]|uniref:uncharacterized protein n=1 Tax=Penicillium hispanicum TaxID=1080232 RepID=UPI0025415C6B|nr:uncharacterized protein N7459_007826 [Penicillium hispanicum]KAJ5573399.1 hypothetical protein N7459_007826 [Penicillium hispanicum]
MTPDHYDSDDAMNRSPPLLPSKVKYGVDESPPPFVSRSDGDATEKCAKGTPDRSRKPHLPETQTSTRYGDSVLISFLEPARPDIAAHARDHPLTAWSLQAGPGSAREEGGANRGGKERGGIESPRTNVPTLPPPPAPLRDIKPDLASPPRQRPRLPSITAPVRRLSEDPLRLSPPFRDATKPSPILKDRISLPSLQSLDSPPSSCAGTSSEASNNQSLPSISSALNALGPDFSSSRLNGLPPPPSYSPYSSGPTPVSSRDSPHDHHLPAHFLPSQIPPSPLSHLSPVSTKGPSNNPSPASQPSFWRTPASKLVSITTSAAASISAPTPAPPPPLSETHAPSPYEISPMTTKSPTTGYPTPTEQIAPGAASERASFSSNPSPNDVGASGNYKCTHPGCTAAPFQTQYLLNSHANVHSQDRPHFCPVEGCPRGVGGKGFKRKNEMMRHGLVHNSPGYVCPFCPDQQHKYPRPDNLQRYRTTHDSSCGSAWLILLADMSGSITSIKTKTTPPSAKSSHSGQSAAHADGAGD